MKVLMVLVVLALVAAGCSSGDSGVTTTTRAPATTRVTTTTRAPATTRVTTTTRAPAETVTEPAQAQVAPEALEDFRAMLRNERVLSCMEAYDYAVTLGLPIKHECGSAEFLAALEVSLDSFVSAGESVCTDLFKAPHGEAIKAVLVSHMRRGAAQNTPELMAVLLAIEPNATSAKRQEVEDTVLRREFELVGNAVYFMCPSYSSFVERVEPD
jgi:hypothetical protein